MDDFTNERYLIDGVKPANVSKRFTDSCLRIGNKLYHVECESQNDGSILLRLAEYNVRIAIDNAVNDATNDRVIIRLPESALLRLRSSENNPKISYRTIEYAYEEQSISIKTPVMNVQAYSAQGIGQGIDIGKITARYEDGMPIDQIAAKMNNSEDEVINVLKNAGMLN